MTCIASNPLSISNPPWDQSQDFELIVQTLRDGNIVEQMPMREHLTANFKKCAYRTTSNIKVGVIETADKFSPNQVKAALKTFPMNQSQYPLAEQVAYAIDNYLFSHGTQRHYITPTVVRKVDSQILSVSYFVESKVDLLDDFQFEKTIRQLNNEDMANAQALVTTLPHSDAHRGNWIAAHDKNDRTCPVFIDIENFAEPTINPLYGTRSWSVCHHSTLGPEKWGSLHFPNLNPPVMQQQLRQVFPNFPDSTFEAIYPHLEKISSEERKVLYGNQSLWVQYFENNPHAFPCAPNELPDETIKAYRHLTIDTLTELCKPLIDFDPNMYDPKKGSHFMTNFCQRIETMLDRVRPMERSCFPTPATS